MTKAHEETWGVDGDGDVRRVNRKGEMTSLVWLRAASGSLESNILGAAAPDMARVLLRFRNAHLGQDSAEEMEQALLDAEAALAKAGVPLP